MIGIVTAGNLARSLKFGSKNRLIVEIWDNRFCCVRIGEKQVGDLSLPADVGKIDTVIYCKNAVKRNVQFERNVQISRNV